MANQYYEDTIWTNHALNRIFERGLSQEKAYQAFKSPDHTQKGRDGALEFQKKFGSEKVTLIAKQNDRSEWVVLSAWIDPPLPGSRDDVKQKRYQAYLKAGFWGKLWMEIKRDVFGF
jgi:hypothetical protein